jgi:hypothetical protein
MHLNLEHEIDLLFSPGELISGKSLSQLSKHYSIDTTLRCVYIPKVKVEWDELCGESKAKLVEKEWQCAGGIDLFMIFDWLKTTRKVKKLIEVVVDDSEDAIGVQHSDHAIVKCLQDLQVEVWDWQRLDIPSDVIFRAAENNVRVVHLYCSGLNAVLRSWSDRSGLPMLKKVGLPARIFGHTDINVHSSKKSTSKPIRYALHSVFFTQDQV